MTEAESRPPAISVEGASKRFRLYRERPQSLKQVVTRHRGARYEEFWALRDVSLEVPAGVTYGLVGHNGSGKSTLLRLMAGIHRPTSGTVTTRGRISALLELGAGFHPELSGRENVYLNGSILGLGRKEVHQALDEIVEFSGLGHFIDTPVKIYSSGMYVRLGFSVAVHLKPEVLLIDEIIAVGDEEFQRRCFDHLYRLRRQGVTIVIVTHSLPLVETMCDRVAWLDHGRLLAQGPAHQVVGEYLRKVNADEGARLGQSADGSADDAQRRGSGELQITGVDFLGADGRPSRVAGTGLPLTVRVHFSARTPVTEPVFGLAFHHESGVHLAGPNTRFAEVSTGVLEGDGSIDYHLDRLVLMPGTYLVTAAVFDSQILHPYDFWDRAFPLHVQPGASREQYGLVELPGRWAPPVPAGRVEAAS